MNILFLANELRNTSGVTTHLYNLLTGLKTHSENKYFVVCGSCPALHKFRSLNVEVEENKNFLHENRSFRNFFNALVFLRKFCREHKINIIHSHTHYAANIAYHTSYTINVTTVQTNHGILEPHGTFEHFKAHKYIAVNEHIYNYLLSNNIAGKADISLIRCGIPVPRNIPDKNYQNHSTLHSPLDKAVRLKFIAASRFTQEKGLDTYVKAVGLLPQDYKLRADFLIAGEGEQESYLRQMNSESGSALKFLGNLENLSETLSGTNVFLYPSRSSSEGFPAVITEAAAQGNLIIASDFYGLSSVFQDGKHGIIFRMDDEKDLCEKLKYVIDNYETMNPIIQNFYIKVREEYDLNTMVEKHRRLYEQCL